VGNTTHFHYSTYAVEFELELTFGEEEFNGA
jgi:hypothetical protein